MERIFSSPGRSTGRAIVLPLALASVLARVYYSARSEDLIGVFFSIFSNMKVCCVFSLEWPHNIPLSKEKGKHPKNPKYNNVCSYGIFRDTRTSAKQPW